MSDSTDQVPPEGPGTFLDGSEPVDDHDADPSHGSQALMPSDLEEPALVNGVSDDDEDGSAA